MNSQSSQVKEFRATLRTRSQRYDFDLDEKVVARLCDFYALLLTWNPRMHLVAPCTPAEFATRHVLESLLLLPHLARSARVADIGSGAGLPIIPNLIARPDIQAILFESSKKKAVFLREALRVTRVVDQAGVIAERFEDVATPAVGFVTCRALDRFSELFPELIDWAPRPCTLLLFGGAGLQQEIEKAKLEFSAFKIPDTERRFLFSVTKL
ncbi:MAG: methyltransferase GidB [Acidobacteria bacterium]|nr:methyltransferase GidB [Acidobacteriota bacterium]